MHNTLNVNINYYYQLMLEHVLTLIRVPTRIYILSINGENENIF